MRIPTKIREEAEEKSTLEPIIKYMNSKPGDQTLLLAVALFKSDSRGAEIIQLKKMG